jgi:hypothetical protein
MTGQILRYPRLDTVMMVEKTIKKYGKSRKKELWQKLPKKMMYQTFSLIIDYLAYSSKILIDSDNRIYWAFNEANNQLKYKPQLMRKVQKKEIKEEKSSILSELLAQEAQENQQIHEYTTYIG